MAKKITIDIEVNGKMQKATLSAKKLRAALDDVDSAQERAGNSARTYDRNTKGAAKATSNSTKEFSKMAQGMGGLVGAYATVAASVFALSAAFQFFKTAADLSALTSGQELFAARTGISMKLMTANIQDATGGLIAFREAAQAAAIGQAAGLTADQMERLGRVAKNAGTILGRDVTDAFNRLTRGAIKAEPELLDELGIIIRIDRASRDYAATINKNVKDLTQFEKTQAVVNAVLEQGEQKFDDIGDAVNNVAQFGAAFQDTFKDLAKPIADIANFVSGALKDSIFAVSAVMGILGLNIVKSFAPAIPVIQSTAEAGIGARKRLMSIANQEATEGVAVKIRQGQFEEGVLKQIVRSANSKTSQVINLSMMERQAIERDVEIIRAQNLRMTRDGAGFFKAMVAGWKLELLSFQQEYGKRFALMRLVTAKFAMMFSKLLSIATFAGLITIVVELGKEFRRTFLISEDLADAERATENLTAVMERQRKEIKNVKQGFKETDNQLTLLTRSFNILSNYSFKPLIAQVNELKDATEKLALAELQRERQGEGPRPSLDARLTETSTGATTFLNPGDMAGTFRVPGEEMGVSTVGELNDALIESALSVNALKSELAEVEKTLLPYERIGNETIGELKRQINEATNTFNNFSEVARLNQLDLVNTSPEARVAFERLQGLEVMLPGMRAAINDINETSLVDEDAVRKMDELEQKVAAARAAFDGVDTAGFIAAVNAAGDASIDQQSLIENAQQEAAKLGATFTEITKSVAGFGEASGKFMPDGSDFTGLFVGLDNIDKTLGNLLEKVPKLSQIRDEAGNIKVPTIGELIGTDGKGKDETIALQNAYNLIEDIAGKAFEAMTIEELQQKIQERRLQLTETYKTLEEEGLKNQKDRVGVLEAAVGFEKASLKAKHAAEDSALELKKIEAEIETAKLAGLALDSETLRNLNNRKDLLTAINNQKQEEKRIEELLLPIIREKVLLERDNARLQLQSNFNRELEKQVSLQNQIKDSVMTQAEADLAFKIKEAGVRNPFFNQERASAKFRLDMEERFAEYKEQMIKNEFDMKRQAIEMEYNLLTLKSQIAAKEAQIAADRARELGKTNAEQLALASHYDELANMHLSFLPQYQAGKDLAIQLADQLEKASLADLKRLRADLQLAIQEMEPMNMLLDDAAKAFGSSLNDAVNALFTSMHDKSMDLGETLKEIGRGLLQTIQQAVTKRLIVDPLLESLGLLDDPTAAMKQAIEEAADKLAEKSAKAITDTASTVESGGDKVATKVKGSFDQGATTAASKIREAIRDIELRIKVQCCEGGGTGSDAGDAVADAVSSAVGGAAKGGLQNDGSGISVNADDPLIKQQLLSMKQSLLPQGQPEMMGYDFKTSVAEGVKQGILQSQADSMAQMKDPGSVGPMDSSLTDIAAPKLPPKPGTEAIANTEDAEETKAAATEENTGMLTKLGDVMGENVLQTGLAVSALLGNSKAGQALQKVMLALNAGQMIMKLWTALNTKSEVANTAAVTANTAAVTAAAAANAVPGRSGIYPPLGYASGGIARGPNAGYPAILHGTEAVVPLPNGKDIPVEMKGGGTSQQNNVTVNVTVDNQGQGTTESSQSDGERGGQLGAVISMAVQKELQNQKRPGGILSPYGVT